MKKIYINPVIKTTRLETLSMMAGSPITGNGTSTFSGSDEGTDGEEGDVKGHVYNVWNDDWSN